MSHLGRVLVDALLAFRGETAVIEVRRDRETRRLAYDDLLDQAASLAMALRARGIGPEDRVALLAENQAGWLVTGLAVWWVGGVLVPLDARLPAEDQAHLLEHARPALLVADAGLARALPGWEGPWLEVEGPDWPVTDRPDALPAVARREPEDAATLVYTSGTGGAPRACVLSHRAYLAQWERLAEVAPLAPGDRWFSFLPTNHAIDFMCGFIGPLACGATVVHQRVLRPEHLLWTLRTQGITHFAVVPSILEAFRRGLQARLDGLPAWKRTAFDGLAALHARWTWAGPDRTLASWMLPDVQAAFGGRLRRVYCGGAPTDPELVGWFTGLGVPVAVGYGLTEACAVLTLQDLSPPRVDTVGRALPGVELRIADPGPDGVGEVQVRSATLMSGYLDDPEATANAFTLDGFLRTGDLGRLDPTGHLRLVGRARDCIVTTGGKNVYPEDVEAGLGALPCDEFAVFAAGTVWPDRGIGGLAEELVLVVRGGSLDDVARALAERQRTRPPRVRVRSVVCVDEPFPRTATRKVRRHELADRVRGSESAPVALQEVSCASS